MVDFDSQFVTDHNEDLNRPFDVPEIKKAISQLKNNKCPSSFDNVLNEFLKYNQCDQFLLLTCRLFNLIFDSGVFPEVWSKGIIFPIYKNKGSANDPDNYRGITILSCYGKLFTAVLNNRLNSYLESYNVLCEEQAGFRKHYSTVDHVFTLKMLIDFYMLKGKKLYCAFIDYKKAFDCVNRAALWQKLLEQNIDGKCIRIIHDMYVKAKSCIKVGNSLSDFFSSYAGVRQGENLSPILFSMFLNDLAQFMSTKFEGLENFSRCTFDCLSDDDLEVYLRLYLLLYADDTVILAESHDDLQHALNAMLEYCNIWDLKVNPTKTKVTVFCKNKKTLLKERDFHYNNVKVDIVEEFVYLGVLFTYNGKFNKTKKRLLDQARKAMFSLIQKSRRLDLSISVQLHLFNTMIVPILLYGAEVWAFEDLKILDQFQLQYCKMILKLKKSTTSCMIYYELGITPISLQAKLRLLSYWGKFVDNVNIVKNASRINSIVYRTICTLHMSNVMKFPWLSFVANTLNHLGVGMYFDNQSVVSHKMFKHVVKSVLHDQFVQSLHNDIDRSPKCLVYKAFKKEFCFEDYLDFLPKHLSLYLLKFRLMNHKFPIETGRYHNIARQDRICHLCNNIALGDEFHYLLECQHFSTERKKNLKRYFTQFPNCYKLDQLMNSKDCNEITKLALFCKHLILNVTE